MVGLDADCSMLSTLPMLGYHPRTAYFCYVMCLAQHGLMQARKGKSKKCIKLSGSTRNS